MISLPLFLSKCQCMVECKNEGTQTCQVSLSVAFFHYTATKYRSRGSLVYYVVGRVIKWTHKMMMLNYCSIYKAKSHFLPSLSQFFCSQNYDYKFLTTPTCGMSYYYQENVSLPCIISESWCPHWIEALILPIPKNQWSPEIKAYIPTMKWAWRNW